MALNVYAEVYESLPSTWSAYNEDTISEPELGSLNIAQCDTNSRFYTLDIALRF